MAFRPSKASFSSRGRQRPRHRGSRARSNTFHVEGLHRSTLWWSTSHRRPLWISGPRSGW